MKTDQPISYAVTDLQIPYRVRVLTASPDLREFVVPRLGIQPPPREAKKKKKKRPR